MSKKKSPPNAEKQPKNLTLSNRVLGFADQIMDLMGKSSLSELVENLITDEYEKRFGVIRQVGLSSCAAHGIAKHIGQAVAGPLLGGSPEDTGPKTPELPPHAGDRGTKGKKGNSRTGDQSAAS